MLKSSRIAGHAPHNGKNGKPAEVCEQVIPIPVDEIMPDPEQPRQFFDSEALCELGRSIKEGRQVQAIIVCRVSGKPSPIKYMLVGGERRWRAHRIAGLKTINAIVRDYGSDFEREKESVTDNTGREDIDDLDMARKLHSMKVKHNMTIADLAKMASVETGWISQRLMLLNLHPEIQARLGRNVPEEDRLQFSIAIRLAAFPDQNRQLELYREIVAKRMSMKAAFHFLRMAAVADGALRLSERSPNRDRHMVSNSIERMSTDLEFFLSMGGSMFDRSFSSQTRRERRQFLELIDKVEESLKMVREEVSSLRCSDDRQSMVS